MTDNFSWISNLTLYFNKLEVCEQEIKLAYNLSDFGIILLLLLLVITLFEFWLELKSGYSLAAWIKSIKVDEKYLELQRRFGPLLILLRLFLLCLLAELFLADAGWTLWSWIFN